jgi:hypothetical protein
MMKILRSNRENLKKSKTKHATPKEISTKEMNYMPKHCMHRQRAIILTIKTTWIITPKRTHAVILPRVCQLENSKRKMQRCQRKRNKLKKRMDQ